MVTCKGTPLGRGVCNPRDSWRTCGTHPGDPQPGQHRAPTGLIVHLVLLEWLG